MEVKLRPFIITVVLAVFLGLSLPLSFLFGSWWTSHGAKEVKKLRIAQQGQQLALPPGLAGVHHIVCVGDSVTEQGENVDGYVSLLRAYLSALFPNERIAITNAGHSGDTSDEMLARFDRVLSAQPKPDLITINAGLNDVARRGDKAVETYRKSMTAMAEKAKAAGMKVILLSPTMFSESMKTPHNDEILLCAAALKDVASKTKSEYVDLGQPLKSMIDAYRSTGANDLLVTTDGMHLNALGNRVVANTIMSHLGITSEMRASVE